MSQKPPICEEKLKKARTLNYILCATTLVAAGVAGYLAYALHREPHIVGGGTRIPISEAVAMVNDFQASGQADMFGGTTSFIISKDSLALMTQPSNVTHIHAFFGKAATGVTLVFTGARIDSTQNPMMYVNEPFIDEAGVAYAMEHVIPCIGVSNNPRDRCTLVLSDGTASNETIEANGSPDNNPDSP